MLLNNTGSLEKNNDSPITEHRQGLLILRAGEIAQVACQILLHVTAGHGHDQGTSGLSMFCQKKAPNNKTPKPTKQNESKKQAS